MTFSLKVSKKKLILPAMTFLIFLAGIILCNYFGIIFNFSPSMKIGLYQKARGVIRRGDLVLFCLHEPYKTLALARRYLGPSYYCGGADPMIKQVISVPGDDVKLLNNKIVVNGKNYLYKTVPKDNQGRILNKYPRGFYPKTSGYWVIGTNSNYSWDSRYWGAIDRDLIIAGIRPLLIW